MEGNGKPMKFIKKCPVFMLLISTGLLFTIIGIGGRSNIYAEQEYEPLTTPVMALMFRGLNEDKYPWQILSRESQEVMATDPADAEEMTDVSDESSSASGQSSGDGTGSSDLIQGSQTEGNESPAQSGAEGTISGNGIGSSVSGNSVSGNRLSESEFPEGRLEPLRESTHEEYLNHISADIYGDMGVKRAASFAFKAVDESYFDDALFIGDSRTVGLRDYTDLSEHADFYCETSLTIYKVLEENFKGKGTVTDALAAKDYGKIYLMVGINELGRGTTEDFMAEYTKVVDTLHELAPEAKIFIQGIMRVSGKKNASDAIFNNSNINARNNAIATLADNVQFFYIDVNEAVCDEEGNLEAEYTFDQIHLLGVYNDLWKQFLLEHGVLEE